MQDQCNAFGNFKLDFINSATSLATWIIFSSFKAALVQQVFEGIRDHVFGSHVCKFGVHSLLHVNALSTCIIEGQSENSAINVMLGG